MFNSDVLPAPFGQMIEAIAPRWTAKETSSTARTPLTGLLCSGKTTLLRRALVDPSFSDTAVVINEIGEIAIDHNLVDFVEGQDLEPVTYTHLRAHETRHDLVCRL